MRVTRAFAASFLSAGLLASCSSAPPPAPATPRAPVAVQTQSQLPPPAAIPPAPAPLPAESLMVPVPQAFRDAIAAGTRTPGGAPGPKYWQQRVDYRIDAHLDPKSALLEGEETVRYVNNSPDTLPGLVLHLYQNLFKPGEARREPVPQTTGMTLERVVVGGKEAREVKTAVDIPGATGAAYQVQGTIMLLRLPQKLLPHDSTTLQVSWHYTVPAGSDAPRTKHIGSQLYLMAQWYPQIAVYDDVHGWHTGQYLGTGEFYLEYGSFNVALTLPQGYLVAATGELQNDDEVLPAQVRARLKRALQSDAVVHVVTEDDIAAHNATEQDPGRELTWRFQAKDVRDFAFATSNKYLWDATRGIVPNNSGTGTRTIPVNAFYRSDASNWRDAARYSKHSVQFHATHWHPYIYPQITSAEGPEGGMEYPMIVFVTEYQETTELYDVLTHEIGHEWFPMMVGSDEKEYAWMDEGVNTYIEQFANKDIFREFVPFHSDLENYLGIAGSEDEAPMMRGADLFPSGPAYGVGAYSKPSVALHTLAMMIGEEKMQEALQEYARKWLLKHPLPNDFFNTVNTVAGKNYDWFWYPWFFTTDALDQAVGAVQTRPNGAGETATIMVDNVGRLPGPVELLLTERGGQRVRAHLPADVWATGQRRTTQTIELDAPLEKVEIDPEVTLPDVNRSNNVWERPKP